MGGIEIEAPAARLEAAELLDLSIRSWGRGSDDMLPALAAAIVRTQNVTARDQGRLVRCARILSDGFFATVPEILVDQAYQGRGIGRALMAEVIRLAPSRLGFGVQPGREAFFELCGFRRSRVTWFALPRT